MEKHHLGSPHLVECGVSLDTCGMCPTGCSTDVLRAPRRWSNPLPGRCGLQRGQLIRFAAEADLHHRRASEVRRYRANGAERPDSPARRRGVTRGNSTSSWEFKGLRLPQYKYHSPRVFWNHEILCGDTLAQSWACHWDCCQEHGSCAEPLFKGRWSS